MSQHEEKRTEDRGGWFFPIMLWDMVLLLLLLIVGVGLLLPFVHRIRDGDGNRMKCLNNLRQIGLATLSAESMHKRLPPFFGSYSARPPSVHGLKGDLPHSATIYYHLLPHLEQAGIYGRTPPLFDFPETNQYVLAPKAPLGGTPDENAAPYKVHTYMCPGDASGDPSGVEKLSLTGKQTDVAPWGSNSYSANYLLFGMVKDPRLPESIPDGLSSTIFFTEKATICNDAATGRRGGNLWAVPGFFPSDAQASVNFGGTLGFDPAPTNPTRPYSLALFQSAGPGIPCDPALAQSPHAGGINVSMGDGGCQFISTSVSPATWSALLTPYPIRGQARSDVPGDDWQ